MGFETGGAQFKFGIEDAMQKWLDKNTPSSSATDSAPNQTPSSQPTD